MKPALLSLLLLPFLTLGARSEEISNLRCLIDYNGEPQLVVTGTLPTIGYSVKVRPLMMYCVPDWAVARVSLVHPDSPSPGTKQDFRVAVPLDRFVYRKGVVLEYGSQSYKVSIDNLKRHRAGLGLLFGHKTQPLQTLRDLATSRTNRNVLRSALRRYVDSQQAIKDD